MKKWILLLITLLISVPVDSAMLASEPETTRPNILLICIDDLRPELNCFGAKHISSPNIDRLASQGVLFSRHYVQAPTCGASRFTLLTGHYGSAGNGALFERSRRIKSGKQIPVSMPAWFRRQGYETVSVGKVSHHPGGRGGKDWNDDDIVEMPDSWDVHISPAGQWKHPRGWMHGLADGEIRIKAGQMDVFQAVDGKDNRYPDGESIEDAIGQLKRLTQDESKPFFLAVGILRPHLPFGAPAKYVKPYDNIEFPETAHPEKPTGKTTWHGSGEFMKYNRWGRNPNKDKEFALAVRKHYAGCVSFADAMVGRLLDTLEKSGKADNTIVVLWGDHGCHLGEHAIWGKHALFEESLRSPLIIKTPGNNLIAGAGTRSSAVIETVDIFPTLCELIQSKHPESCSGVSLIGIKNSDHPRSIAADHGAISYKANAKTIRTNRYRLIEHKSGDVELYDHQSADGETKNIAEGNKAIVETLRKKLAERLAK